MAAVSLNPDYIRILHNPFTLPPSCFRPTFCRLVIFSSYPSLLHSHSVSAFVAVSGRIGRDLFNIETLLADENREKHAVEELYAKNTFGKEPAHNWPGKPRTLVAAMPRVVGWPGHALCHPVTNKGPRPMASPGQRHSHIMYL